MNTPLKISVPLNVRNVAIMIIKNAVNAAILSGIQIYHDPADNNWHTRHGIYGILWTVTSAVIAREGVILIPKILKWSQTNGAVALLAILLLAAGAHAQSSPSGYPFTITGNYVASTNNATPNGAESTFEYWLNGRTSLYVDEFIEGSSNAQIAGGQYMVPANAIFGKKAPASFSSLSFGAHGGLGDVLSNSRPSFAAAIGFSVRYKISSIMAIEVVRVTDVYSRGWTPHNQLIGNYNNIQIGPGIVVNF